MLRLFIFLIAITMSVQLSAQSVEKVLDKYFTNTGGADNWKRLKSTQIDGKMAMQGFEFPGTVINKAPNKMRAEVNVQGMKIVQAYDGTTAWWINPFASGEEAQVMPDEMSESLTNQELESPFLDYATKGHKVDYEGEGEIEGTKTQILKLTKKNGDVEYHYFDSEYFVPVMTKTMVKNGPMKGQFTETYMSDYQEVDGLMFPFFMETKMDGQTVQKMVISSMKTNVEAADELFAFPKK